MAGAIPPIERPMLVNIPVAAWRKRSKKPKKDKKVSEDAQKLARAVLEGWPRLPRFFHSEPLKTYRLTPDPKPVRGPRRPYRMWNSATGKPTDRTQLMTQSDAEATNDEHKGMKSPYEWRPT